MDPSSGRFTAADCFGGNPHSAISLHRYLYANASPVSHSDPTGYFTMVEMSAALAVRGVITSLQINTGSQIVQKALGKAAAQGSASAANMLAVVDAMDVVSGVVGAAGAGLIAYKGIMSVVKSRLVQNIVNRIARKNANEAVGAMLRGAAQAYPGATVGWRGSVATGKRIGANGMPKNPPDWQPNDFDVDAFIVSDELLDAVGPKPSVQSLMKDMPELGHYIKEVQEQMSVQFPNNVRVGDDAFSIRIWSQAQYDNKVSQGDHYIFGE